MKYTLIWADNGAILDTKLVRDSLQEILAAKKRYQKSVQLMTSPAQCATAWAVQWKKREELKDENGEPIEDEGGGIIFHVIGKIESGLKKVEAYKKKIQAEAAGAENVKMYEYVSVIID